MSPRIRTFVLCGLPILFSAVGCRVSGSAFQMDSDHRTPSLGLQLSPRKERAPKKRTPKKRMPKDDRSIRQIGGVENRSSGPKPPIDAAAPQRSAWSRLLGRFGKPKRIPLPRTDIRSGEDASGKDGSGDLPVNEF